MSLRFTWPNPGGYPGPDDDRPSAFRALRAFGVGPYSGTDNPAHPHKIPVEKRGTPAKVQFERYSDGVVYMRGYGKLRHFESSNKRQRKAKARGV